MVLEDGTNAFAEKAGSKTKVAYATDIEFDIVNNDSLNEGFY